MVLGALGKITGEGVRALARNLFPGFYDRGLSANDALNELRGAGLGYRRQDFLNDFRTGESIFKQETRVRFVGEDKTPGEGILYGEYHGVPDKYSFVFKATGTNTDTGEETTSYFYYHRNTLDTRRNLEAEAQSWAESEAAAYPIEIENVQLVEGYINPVWQ